MIWCWGNIAQKHNWARGSCWDGDESCRRRPKWNGLPMRCSRLRRSTYAQPGRGRERTSLRAWVSTCKQNGLAHERLRYPKPSFCRRFGLPKLKTSSGDLSVIIDVDDQPLRSNSPLAMLHVDAGELRHVHAAQSLSSRVTNLCKASFGQWYSLLEHDFSSHDDFERGRRREMSSLKNEREQSLPRETAPQPTTVTCTFDLSRAIAVGFWLRHFVFK